MSEAILLSEIKALQSRSKELLLKQLSSRGVALLEIDEAKEAEALHQGLLEAKNLSSFRFPPINVDVIKYEDIHRNAFRALYETAISCLSLLMGSDQSHEANCKSLFSESLDEPFPLDHAYHPTFFNLFNYDHGALNTHKDRGLLTIIHVDPPQEAPHEASALWIEGPQQTWSSGDELIRKAKVKKQNNLYALLLVGEEGETLFHERGQLDLYAADHSVRVEPTGEYISHSHHQRDPQTRPHNNRLSAALILRKQR